MIKKERKKTYWKSLNTTDKQKNLAMLIGFLKKLKRECNSCVFLEYFLPFRSAAAWFYITTQDLLDLYVLRESTNKSNRVSSDKKPTKNGRIHCAFFPLSTAKELSGRSAPKSIQKRITPPSHFLKNSSVRLFNLGIRREEKTTLHPSQKAAFPRLWAQNLI